MASTLLGQLDAQLDKLFAGWNVYSTTLLVLSSSVFLLPLFFNSEPDIHPLFLARQAVPSPVRESGQSAVYRSNDIPYGNPLRSGLNIRDDSTSKWGPGRDGDLRDIWLVAAKAVSGKLGKILTLKGNNKPVSSTFEQLSKQINAIGSHIQSQGGKRVLIYLPNSPEFLVSLFACAFYGLVPILVPTDIDLKGLDGIIKQTQADSIIAPSGVVSVNELTKIAPKIKLLIWVVPSTSQQMDFVTDVSTGGIVSEWHELVEKSQADADLPKDGASKDLSNVISVWHDGNSTQVVEYTQSNIISGIAAQLAVLPHGQTLQEKDLIVSLNPLTQTYALSVVLAGLYSHASIALTSVAGLAPDYELAYQGGIKPSIIIASNVTMSKTHTRLVESNRGILKAIWKSRRASSLAAGRMRVVVGQRLRLIYISATPQSATLTSQDLNDIRIFMGSKVIYSLILPQVAGAVAQTNALDYRIGLSTEKTSHFGAPLSSVEMKVVESHSKIADEEYKPAGSLHLSGPAVVGGIAATEVFAKIGDDQTLQLP